MNKVLLAVGLLSAGVAVGQTTQTPKSSSSTTSTSNYNNSNTNNYNSTNATMSSGSASTGTTGSGSTGTTGTYNSNGTYNNSTSVTPSGSNNYNTMGTSGAAATTPTEPYNNSGAGATGTTGTYNSNGTYNNSTSVTPSGSSNYNTMGASGATTTSSTYSTRTRSDDPAGANGYNNFAFGIYAGLNATNFRGESIDTENPSSRLGYQAGLFVRGGGRLFGQIGAEYFASSSNYFRAGNASSSTAVRDYINIQYVQIPVYIGYKLTQSERGNSAVRVQVGAEYANRISSDSRSFNLSGSEIKTGSFNALGQIGFDLGIFLIDLTYHHGLSDAVQINTFQGSTRRILSASVGLKF